MFCLKAEALQKRYGDRTVVRDVSIEINTGQVVGLLGPNGAGKTTSFYMIVGLIKADNGQIFINDKNITKYPMHKRAQSGISYLPQEASIFRKLSVVDNLLAILEMRKLSKKKRLKKAEQLIHEFSLQKIRNNFGVSLSGGERRRVEIARTLATDPCFVLLDEPFAGVDPISVNEIKQIIFYLKDRNIGILITDHNVRETLDICEQAFIVSEGVIIAKGDSHSITNNQMVRDVYLGHNFKI